MKLFTRIMLIGGLLLSTFGACSKKEKEEKREQKQLDREFAGVWKRVLVEESVEGGPWTDVTSVCDRSLVFVMDGNIGHTVRLYFEENQEICGEHTTFGTWAVENGGKKLVCQMEDVVGDLTWDVIKIDGKTLVTVHDERTIIPSMVRTTYQKK